MGIDLRKYFWNRTFANFFLVFLWFTIPFGVFLIGLVVNAEFQKSYQSFYSVNAFFDMAQEYRATHGEFPGSWEELKSRADNWSHLYGETMINELDQVLEVDFALLTAESCPEKTDDLWVVRMKNGSKRCASEFESINRRLIESICGPRNLKKNNFSK